MGDKRAVADHVGQWAAQVDRLTRQLNDARMGFAVLEQTVNDLAADREETGRILASVEKERDEARQVANEVQRMALEGADLEAFQRLADKFQWMEFPG